MNFENLVLNILKESPDSLEFEGQRFAFDMAKGRPITFFVDYLRYTKGTYTAHKADLGMVVVYFNPGPDNDRVTHTELEDILLDLNYRRHQQKGLISFFSPDLNVEERLDQLSKKYPKMSVITNLRRDDMSDAQQGRMWRHEDKVVIALWENDQKFIEKYVIPFAQHVYPDVSIENIYIEDSSKPGTFYSPGSAETNKPTSQEPYQKELINLQRQLHMSSGDEKKRRQIKQQIKDICLKHNLDPKKYGISDDVLKGSELTAQKVLGGSKESMASLKARTQTSESKIL